MLALIEARDLQVGDTIVGKKEIQVLSIERESSCTGLHINVVRRAARAIKRNGKVVGLNADRGQILHSDGCFAPCMPVVIRRATTA